MSKKGRTPLRFPKDYDAKIEKLIAQEGAKDKEDLFRMSIKKLESESVAINDK